MCNDLHAIALSRALALAASGARPPHGETNAPAAAWKHMVRWKHATQGVAYEFDGCTVTRLNFFEVARAAFFSK